MFDEFLPKKKIGLLSPLSIVAEEAYQYYRLVPEGIMFVLLPLGLREYSRKDVERVFIPLEEHAALLVEEGADVIGQCGVPLPIIMGMEYHDNLLDRIAKVAKLPVTSTILGVVAAVKSLGIQNVAVANKWNTDMNSTLSKFFEREGISVAGVSSRPMAARASVTLKTNGKLALAYELGRAALTNYPDADGLYIGGGSWLTLPIIEPLEKEFGKPVVTNAIATVWNTCHLVNHWKPIQGYGRLLQGA